MSLKFLHMHEQFMHCQHANIKSHHNTVENFPFENLPKLASTILFPKTKLGQHGHKGGGGRGEGGRRDRD